LKQLQIENLPALKLISNYRYPEVLIYADPPYPLETRSRRLYKNEMTNAEHLKLLRSLQEHPGPVMISSYENVLYTQELSGWHSEYKKNQTELGKTRIEVLWFNSVAAVQIKAPTQINLDLGV
jgi:DNA adenine methylase